MPDFARESDKGRGFIMEPGSSQQPDQVVKSKALRVLYLALLAVSVGVIAGMGAVVFRGLIAFFHNLGFLQQLSFSYNANLHTPASPWGPLVILVPVVGALGVAFLVKNFAPEAKGHGVPEVMDAVYYNRGIIRPVVAAIKALASALSIGTGGAVGREGPIIQIGSSFGSTVGQVLRLSTWERITLIAATFNTPIGGVLFAIEIMLPEVSSRTLVPVAIATATATYIGRIFFGTHPSFVIPAFETPYFHLIDPVILPSYVILGLLMGCVSALFIKSIYWFEDFFESRIKSNYYVRHAVGMLAVGGITYGLITIFGHYYIEGVGYATVQDVLTSKLSQTYLLLLLFGLKLFATSITLGSGASGGIFSPALFMGATIGGAYGTIIHLLFSSVRVYPPAFAVAGMAGLVGGATGAALAAIVMIFEMTLDYNVIIPMTITVALSYGVRRLLSRQSIYTLKLARRGHYMPEALRADFHQLQRAREVMDTHFATVTASSTLDDLASIAAENPEVSWFLVTDGDGVRGLVTKEAALTPLCQLREAITLGEIADRQYVTVVEDATLFNVMDAMRLGHVAMAVVTNGNQALSADKVRGLITKHQIGDTMAQAVQLYSDHQE
jgi:CIC family chloride channel protein